MYSELLLKAKSIAVNDFLSSWSENANNLDFRVYETTINNLRHWLPQLELLFKGFSLNKSKFSSTEWGDVSYFYDIHLDGTEARHAEDLNKVIWNYVDTKEKEELFLKGFHGLLDDLTAFWNGVSRETGINTCP